MRRQSSVWLTVAGALVAIGACRRPAQPPPHLAPPATVSGARLERELATVTLTPEAETRLGVEVGSAERRRVSQALSVGGEVVVPPGKSLVVTAPVAGTVVIAGAPPVPGAPLRRGQLVMALAPLPSATDLASADVRLEAARRKRERAAQLLVGGSGTRRALEEAESELALAETNARAGRPGGAGDGGATIRIASPQAGVLRDLRVGPGQTVASGAPLFQVDGSTSLWIRAAVYAGEAWKVDRAAPARVDRLSDRRRGGGVDAAPVAAPPSANPDAATVDFFYQLSAAVSAAVPAAETLRPGQRVGVTIQLTDAHERLVVPWSAVLYDVLGGTWVYVRTSPHVYARHRVEVDHAAGELAVLERGPPPGAAVVKVGAAEIFGTEFGNGK